MLRASHVVRARRRVDGEAELAHDPRWGTVRVIAFAQRDDGAIVAVRAL